MAAILHFWWMCHRVNKKLCEYLCQHAKSLILGYVMECISSVYYVDLCIYILIKVIVGVGGGLQSALY